jgi:hypothetical protein
MGQQASVQLGSSSNLEAIGTNLVCGSKRIEQSFIQIMLVCHYLKGIDYMLFFWGKLGKSV